MPHLPTIPQTFSRSIPRLITRSRWIPVGTLGTVARGCPMAVPTHTVNAPTCCRSQPCTKTFSRMSSELYICLQLDITGHRGARLCQRDPREPREEPGMVLGSPKALTHGPLIPHTRTRRWSSPGASISQGWGQWLWQCSGLQQSKGSSVPWRTTLEHPQHGLGSEMHTAEKHQPPASHGGELPGSPCPGSLKTPTEH